MEKGGRTQEKWTNEFPSYSSVPVIVSLLMVVTLQTLAFEKASLGTNEAQSGEKKVVDRKSFVSCQEQAQDPRKMTQKIPEKELR